MGAYFTCMCLGVPGSQGSLRGRFTGSRWPETVHWFRLLGFGQRLKAWEEDKSKSLLWFLQEGTREAGQTDLGLANLNHFSGLWDAGSVLSSL